MTGLHGVRLLAVAGHLPSRVVTNQDFVDRGMDTSDEWIASRTGISTRRWADDDETLIDLAEAAALKALAEAGLTGADADLVVLATTSMPRPIPGGAGQVAYRIGSRGGTFDLNAGCAGSTYALAVAADAIRAGSAKVAVVVGAEKLTTWMDADDRATAIIFADGAGAFVLAADEDPERQDVGPVAWGNNGDQHRAIRVDEETGSIAMEGQAVFRWATTAMVPLAKEALAKAGIGAEDLAAFVPHQANLRIVDALTRSLGIDETRTAVARDIVEIGNASSATVPVALANLIAAGRAPSGGYALLIAFGAGLAMAAQVVRIP